MAKKPTLLVRVGSTLPHLRERMGGDFEDWVLQGMGKKAGEGGENGDAQVVDVVEGQALPASLADFGRVVVPGSHAMVTDHAPWCERAAEWLRTVAVPSGVPLLGTCFGHQLLAHALGGKVEYLAGGPEYGCVPLLPIDGAALRSDRLFAQVFAATTTPRVFVAHSQTVAALPPNAVALARNACDSAQIVRYAPMCWGVQFHPEFTREVVVEYMQHAQRNPDDIGNLSNDDGGFGTAVLRAFAML